MVVRITVQDTKSDNIYSFELEDDGSVEDIKVLICAESGIDIEEQLLMYNGRILTDNSAKVKSVGITQDALILLTTHAALQGASNMLGQRQMPAPMRAPQPAVNRAPVTITNANDANLLNSFFTDLSKQNIPKTMPKRQGGANFFNQTFNNEMYNQIETQANLLKQQYLNNPQQLHYILNQDPELGNAIAAEDDLKIREIVGERLKKNMEHKRKEMEKQNRLMNADPNDEAAQKEIEEEIRKELVDQNYQFAQEMFPEFFGHITMLYIACKVNGQEIQAFVDSGAQSTIISKGLADKIGLSKLLDTRFAGMAMGIGTSRILGRVHAADMEILGKKFTCSFTVLEDNKVDFLFGLDNLKRHQCNIDLVQNMLHLRNGEISIPFLSEAEIKKKEFEEEKQSLLDQQKKIAGKVNETDVKELMELGYERGKVLEALSICEGNKEHAATYLMSQGGASPMR